MALEAKRLDETPLTVEEQKTLLELVADFMVENESLRASYAQLERAVEDCKQAVDGTLGKVQHTLAEAVEAAAEAQAGKGI